MHDLRDKIHRKEKQISNCHESIQEAKQRLGDLTITIRQKTKTFTKIARSSEKQRMPLSK
jgi:peptidoglycan hydrolase CwlO-like protein